ncbi:MAG: DUF2500 family protein [Armatimonadota bacterium]|nr:DUF2500 family protein [Armatimonadota bacterium]
MPDLFVPLITAILLALLGFAALWAFAFRGVWAPYLSSRRQPTITATAAVASKREEMAESFMHNFERRFGETYDPSDAVRIEPVEWYAAFECEDGETREFPIPRSLYESLIIGDKGVLTWRGNLFVRFTRPGVDRPEKTVPGDWM